LIAVAVVSYNTREHLRACLASVYADSPTEVVVADNGSTDGSIAMVREAFPSATLHIDSSNPGYGAAANAAIAECDSPYVLLLNSDTIVPRGALEAIRSYLEAHGEVAILGPRLVGFDGSLQRSCFPFPTPLLPFIGQRPLVRLLARVPVLRRRHITAWAHDAPRSVPWVVGAALGIRTLAFRAVNGFDESFHMYSEETDLCFRLRAAGWEIHFAPVAEIVHVGSASTNQYPAAMLRELFVSSHRFNERHLRGRKLRTATRVLRATVRARLFRDLAFSRLARHSGQRARYSENVTVWRELLRELR
jgi:GT2 family glycosyltransferase